MIDKIIAATLYTLSLIPNNTLTRPPQLKPYTPNNAKTIMEIYESVYDTKFNRFKHVKFYHGTKEAVEKSCDLGLGVLACTGPFSPNIRVRTTHMNDCDTIAHELLHNIIFELGPAKAQVNHHTKNFYKIVDAVCDIDEYYKKKTIIVN
jgi:hypothetical protein